MSDIAWASMFIPTISLLEVALRGTLVYLGLFALLRIVRRDRGELGVADLLVIVIVADASQNAMGANYESVTEGAVLVGTILFWNHALDWLAFRFPRFGRLVTPRPLLLIKDGRMIRRHMQQQMITQEELMSQLREQGVENMASVKACYLEGDGKISVLANS